MTDITQDEASALVTVLSLAENHPMWATVTVQLPGFADQAYDAITVVRQFLKRNGVLTLHELTQRLGDVQVAVEGP